MREININTFLLFVVLIFPFYLNGQQIDSTFSFIVAGHAYGSHNGGNKGLHPPLLEKLQSLKDSAIHFLILTGDIVNKSDSVSWAQVNNELESIGIPSYYVMGNHDDNGIGYTVFNEKHGSTFYSFDYFSNRFIILNSTLPGRRISEEQVNFLQKEIEETADSVHSVFVFFHEVLWNSHEKYKYVHANSRSRYDQIKNYSNYWTEMHPIFNQYPKKMFYIITGDVGGNADAIATFYDKWGNVVLLASGAGEVENENILKVSSVNKDSFMFSFLPLNNEINMEEVKYYSIPELHDTISGSSVVQGGESFTYSVMDVFNTNEFRWSLSDGLNGESTSNEIEVLVSDQLISGEISVQAYKPWYGYSNMLTLEVVNSNLSEVKNEIFEIDFNFQVLENSLKIISTLEIGDPVSISIVNSQGQVIYQNQLYFNNSTTSTIPFKYNNSGIIFCVIQNDNFYFTRKLSLLRY